MKINIIVLLLFLLSASASAQRKLLVIDVETGKPVNYIVSSLNSKIQVTLQTDRNTKSISPFNYITNDPLGSVVYMEGASKILLTTILRKDSLSYYRYTIVENDTNTIVSNALLTKIDFIWNNRSSWPGYLTMDFGIEKISNRKLTVKIYRLPDASQVTTVIIYNKPLRPAKIIEKALVKQSYFDKNIKAYRHDIIELKKKAQFSINRKNKGIYVSMKKTDLDFAYFIYLIYKDNDGKSPLLHSNNWSYNTIGGIPGYFIEADYFQKPGTYEVIVSPRSNYPEAVKDANQATTRFSFNVLAPPKTYTKKEVFLMSLAGFGVLIMAAGSVIYVVKKKSRRKLILANLQAEISQSELNVVRSQLNPHFVFNALSGIQNLMNKNEVERANGYLNKFARLTRTVLDDKPLISVKDEVELLHDYLSMEQLRFPFAFNIQVDDSLNFSHTEIPAMLLQPFVENAVKHGMASLKVDGTIVIRLLKDAKDLVLTVTDNGNGFDVSCENAGLGLKLSKKRIVYRVPDSIIDSLKPRKYYGENNINPMVVIHESNNY
jgi:two-component system LytT family sensor kinase